MDRLSVLDNSFLDLEKGPTHMHVGGVMVFEGPPLDGDELYEHIESRLHLVPRYRQKLANPPLQAGRPLWVDDPFFNLDYHVRHTALPGPGTIEQLRKLSGRVFSQRLDRSKPLWEMWLAEGLEGNRFAIVSKTHHALIDGMSGVDLVSLLFDATPEPQTPAPPERPWLPKPAPSDGELLAEGVKDVAKAPLSLASRAIDAVREPRRAFDEALQTVQGATQMLGPGVVNPAPKTPLNTSIGTHRRVRWVHAELDDFKRVKNVFGGTVNDVVLTVVSGALRRWLHTRGMQTEGLELRALVPVSVRSDSDKYRFGNRVAAMRGPLPVYAADPVERLGLVTEAMTGLKESKQALGAERLTALQEFAPPTILAQASRINFSTRFFNTIVTNVPGPQFPMYLLGRELEELVPFAFLPQDHALATAIMSYNGKVHFGLLADYDALPDLDSIADHLQDALVELLNEADTAHPRKGKATLRSTNGKSRKPVGPPA